MSKIDYILSRLVNRSVKDAKISVEVKDDIIKKSAIAGAYDTVAKYLNNVRDGVIVGHTSGFTELDQLAGRIGSGQIWTFGGATGIGKSYFVLNMIDRIVCNNLKPSIAVFSTELSREEYIIRLLFKRCGIWRGAFENNPKKYYDSLQKELNTLTEKYYMNSDIFKIYGNIAFIEQIEKVLSESKVKPSLVFIDYVQELQVEGLFRDAEVMLTVAQKLKQMSALYGITFIVMSQVNLYSQGIGYNAGARHTAPLSFGKHLNHVSHTVGILSRDKNEGKVSNLMKMSIYKARGGRGGDLFYEIGNGFQIKNVTQERAVELQDEIGIMADVDEFAMMPADDRRKNANLITGNNGS